MTYRTDMEEAFEEWFQARRRKSWRQSRISSDPEEPSEHWSMGFRRSMHEGWMGAVLWCRLCKREHEGACITHKPEAK